MTTLLDEFCPAVHTTEHQGLVCFQPVIRVYSPFGPITHKADGVLLVHWDDAMRTAEAWARECAEVGYVTG